MSCCFILFLTKKLFHGEKHFVWVLGVLYTLTKSFVLPNDILAEPFLFLFFMPLAFSCYIQYAI